MLHLASTCVLFLVGSGLWFRRRRPEIHFRLMLAAFCTDVLLVVYIEFARHAVEAVVTHIRPLLWFHAGVSLCVLVCYVIMIQLGRPMLNGRYQTRAMHRYVGVAFVILRGLNYITSYMVV